MAAGLMPKGAITIDELAITIAIEHSLSRNQCQLSSFSKNPSQTLRHSS